MATLTTKAALIDRFGEKVIRELTDRSDPRKGVIDDAVLDAAIVTASDFVLSFLREAYDVTSLEANVPAPVDSFVDDLVLWFLSKNPASWVTDKYKAARDWLNLARTGKVTLGLDSLGNAPTSTGETLYCAPGREFTNENLSTYLRTSNLGDCK